MLAVKCILHPTDFSERSDAAFRVACALARDYGARLIVLHVAPKPPVWDAATVPLVLPPEVYREQQEAQLRQIQSPDPRVVVEHRLTESDPTTGILDMVRDTPCDLIVMGTHGRTGLARLLMGSTAEKVVRSAPCPVLTVKMPFPETS